MESAMPSTTTHPLLLGVVRRTLVVTPFWRDAMTEALVVGARSTPETAGRREFCTARERHGPVRAGEIGPVRREIIFEPVQEPARPAPAPVEPPPAAPEAPPREPVPARP
jgi:hypothetical protein